MTEEAMTTTIPVTPMGPVVTMGEFGLTDGDYQRLRARLDVFDETIYMTRFDERGNPISCYEVSPNALSSAFADLPITTGLLPADTLFYNRSGDQVRMALFVPPKRHTLLSTTRKTPYRIPLPPLVWVGEGARYWVFAVKQRPGRDDRLYRCPTPNVYTGRGNGDGAVCRGDVPFPACSEGTIRDAFKSFLKSQFSTHLIGHKSKEFDDDVMKLWRKLHAGKAGEFPLDDLVATNYTMADLMQRKVAR